MPFLLPNQQRQSTEGPKLKITSYGDVSKIKITCITINHFSNKIPM